MLHLGRPHRVKFRGQNRKARVLIHYLLLAFNLYAGVAELAVFNRTPPVADAVRVEKAPRSKFCDAPSRIKFRAPPESRGKKPFFCNARLTKIK